MRHGGRFMSDRGGEGETREGQQAGAGPFGVYRWGLIEMAAIVGVWYWTGGYRAGRPDGVGRV